MCTYKKHGQYIKSQKYLLFYNNNSISITIRLVGFKDKQKISYDRETIPALNYEIH